MIDLTEEADPAPFKPYDTKDIARLCHAFDPLLMDPDLPLDDARRSELAAFARIFDLSSDRPADQVWREVRTVLCEDLSAGPAARSRSTAGRGLTILLVEDDHDVARDLMDILAQAGHRLIGPFHGAEAAEVSAALHQLDVAVVDINLSGPASGVDLARVLDARWGVPVIFMTGDEAAARVHAELARAVVIKPFQAADLLAALDRLARSSL
ncbi:response regulator [Brevundimonas sp.]|uniref:response regulator n=1 Tax=Brevundimonas sp. TaxID=1871086 RepID=UPI003F723E62